MTTLATAATVWHTAPYVYSHIMAREGYTGEEGFGDLIEYRLRAEIIAPRRGTAAPRHQVTGLMLARYLWGHIRILALPPAQ